MTLGTHRDLENTHHTGLKKKKKKTMRGGVVTKNAMDEYSWRKRP